MLTAVLLALLAVVPTALTIFTASGPSLAIDDIERITPSAGETVAAVLLTLLPTAVAAGWVGGVIRRRLRVTGAAVALVLAWLLGALLLPVVAATLGVDARTAVMCFDTCDAMFDTAEPTAALLGVLLGMVVVVVTVVGGAVALVLAAVGMLLAYRRHPTAGLMLLVVAFGVLNLVTLAVFEGAVVPFVCLALGVVVWDRWLAGRERAADLSDALAVDPSPAAAG